MNLYWTLGKMPLGKSKSEVKSVYVAANDMKEAIEKLQKILPDYQIHEMRMMPADHPVVL